VKFSAILFLGILLISLASATTDIAYVLKDTSHPESKIVNAIEDLGFTYSLIDDSAVSATNFDNYGMILLGDEGIDGVPVDSHQSLTMDFGYSSSWAARSGYTTYNQAFNLEGDQITDSIEGLFTPYTGGTGHRVRYLSYKKYSDPVTTKGSSSTDQGYYVVAKKDSPRRILFGLPESDYWTSASEDLFKNALTWVIKGPDEDGDGYLSGDDCDDTDASIHPGASDLSKNCVNDAPTLGNIQKVIISRGETAQVTLNAADPEGDTLTYKINDLRFTKTGTKTFSWDADGYGVGTYSFEAEVSDGKLKDTKSFDVEIRNKVPVCNYIPNLIWNEDNEAILNLNDYCSDPDGDSLTFGLEDTSEDLNIWLYSFVGGIAKLSSAENWFGRDWAIFSAKDVYSKTLTNNVTLVVNPVNDEPEEINTIADLSWNEDEQKTLNLANYFNDIDSTLTYSVTGNDKIEISFNQDMATLTPEENWFGTEEVIFTASDGETEVSTAPITLEVRAVNDAPEFNQLDCQETILEDESYTCTVTASDVENNTLVYSVVSENKLDCSFSQNILTYKSYQDYFGDASCRIRVSDGNSYDLTDLNVAVENVNDGPFITTFSPNGNVKILRGNTETFTVNVNDIDNSDLTLDWILDQVPVQTGDSNSYTFDKDVRGTYNLKIIASDGILFDEIEWTIFVGEMSDFTCEEVGGFPFEDNEVCNGNLLGVSDTNSCCSIQGIYGFKDIDRCDSPNSNLILEIRDPSNGEEYTTDEEINVDLMARNNFADDANYRITAYLYDLTNDEVVEKEDTKLKIYSGDKEDLEISLGLVGDHKIDLENDFAVFALMEDRGSGACQEDYVEIDPKGKDHELTIEGLSVTSKGLSCGDNLNFRFNIENIGENDEDVNVRVRSQGLGISDQLEEFALDKGEKEKISDEKFDSLRIPENVGEGDYNIDFVVSYDGSETITKSETLEVLSCNPSSSSGISIEPISLTKATGAVIPLGDSNPAEQTQPEETTNDSGNSDAVKSFVTIIFAIFVIGFIVLKYAVLPFI